jgi:hypothetical protein
MPNTTLGRLSCRLAIGSVAAFAVFFGLVAAGQRGGEEFFSNPWLAMAILSAAGLAVTGAAVGIAAIARQGERAWTVIGVTLFGLLVTLFAVGEVLFPH